MLGNKSEFATHFLTRFAARLNGSVITDRHPLPPSASETYAKMTSEQAVPFHLPFFRNFPVTPARGRCLIKQEVSFNEQ